MSDFNEFCDNFDLISNALSMRNMIRWNGRDLKSRENLSEHTHLVVVCALDILDSLPKNLRRNVNVENLIRMCLIHDSLEMLRGDILSVTKDSIPYLRDIITKEENDFITLVIGEIGELEKEICNLADLKACYKYIEFETRYPSNDFALRVYSDCFNKFKNLEKEFKLKYGLYTEENVSEVKRLSKGHFSDAGTDIILSEDLTFMPHCTTTYTFDFNICPKEGDMAVLCARTSAAIKGIIVATCPIDPHYKGNITAIVSNVSNDIITFKRGESFAQVIFTPFVNYKVEEEVRKKSIREFGKLGSTT